MKWLAIVISQCLLLGCGAPVRNFTEFLPMVNTAGKDKVMIISCIKCSCVLSELNRIYQTKPGLLSNLCVITDTACTSGLPPGLTIRHVSQASIDSISVDVYNALVYNRKSNENRITLLETKNAGRLAAMLR